MSPALALIEYFPSKSVCAPVLVPLITTVTPGKLPELSDTVPETVFSCANDTCTNNANNSVKIPLNFVFIFYNLN